MIAFKRLVPLSAVVSIAVVCAAQSPSPGSDQTGDIAQLRSSLAATRSELQQCRQEIDELREQIRAIQKQVGSAGAAAPAATVAASASQFPTAADVEQNPAAAQPQTSADEDLLAAKVAEFEQTKIESASKFKVRVSGMVLMNAYTNVGAVDITDLPNLAHQRAPGDTNGDVGATLRQTTVGLQVTGPTIAGARSSADLNVDFYGGLPRAHYGATMGAVRMRTAHARLDWQNWSIIAGQDSPFFSPLSPTSFASLAEPAFSWSGNLWVWTPQIRAERRWSTSEKSNVAWSFGILDPLSEETPDASFNRHPLAGEASRMPGLGTHFAWNSSAGDRQATVGIGGYFGHQNWGFGKRNDSWLVSADFDIPLGRFFALSGEVYRGQAIGGLGGGIWASALFNGDPEVAGTSILPLNDIGGWSQLKFKPVDKLELNVAAGTANPFARDLEFFPNPRNYSSTPLSRNQTLLINSIFRPRSNLLLGLEYRRLRTYSLTGSKSQADHVNISIGVSF
jgi:hypothetical protein